MLSQAEKRKQPKAASRRFADGFEIWNRKLHYYIGLYLLFFVWLFAFTGLLLNHNWKFAEFWPNRAQSTLERQIQPPPPGGDLVRAKDLMRQLGVEGEIEWATTRPDSNRLDFQVNRPGKNFQIQADFAKNRVVVHRSDLNAWGVMHVLHTFTGVHQGDSRNRRDWILTTVWALSMDGVAAGLILMLLSSLYMWWRLKQKRTYGLLALGLGVLSCGAFVFGLRLFA